MAGCWVQSQTLLLLTSPFLTKQVWKLLHLSPGKRARGCQPIRVTTWPEALALEQAGIELTQAQRSSVPLSRGDKGQVAVLSHPKLQALLYVFI